MAARERLHGTIDPKEGAVSSHRVSRTKQVVGAVASHSGVSVASFSTGTHTGRPHPHPYSGWQQHCVVPMTPTILVADDEQNIIKLLRMYLHEEGCDVVTARVGREALDRFRTDSPDLVLLDLLMP